MPAQKQYHIATDDTLRETIAHGSENYPFAYYWEDVWQFDFHRIDWHWHHEVEFLTVTEGTLHCLAGEDTFQLPEGYGLFINSGILHRFEAFNDRTVIPNIVFSPTLFAPEESLVYEKYVLPVISSGVPYCVFDPQTEWQKDALEALAQIYSLQEDERDNELLTLQIVLKLWGALFQSLRDALDAPAIRHIDHRQAKLRMMMQYIHDHYGEQITLEQIAGAASISKSSALNIFQSGIRTSPVSYAIQYRLKRAGQLLCTTEKSVSAVAEETGFSSAGYFCRKFKEFYHMSPIEYKREKQTAGLMPQSTAR